MRWAYGTADLTGLLSKNGRGCASPDAWRAPIVCGIFFDKEDYIS
jgi:hypothetical protein